MILHRTFFIKIAVFFLVGVALYSGAGFLLAPHLFKNWMEATVAEHSEQRLHVQKVTFNPFTFRLTLTDASLQEPNDDRLLTIPGIVARVDLTKIVARTLVFREAELRDLRIATPADGEIVMAPRVHAASINVDLSNDSAFVDRLRIERPDFRLNRDPTGGLNLPGWLVRLPIDPTAAMITIRSVEVIEARASITDQQITPPIRLEADAINGTIVRQGADSATTVDLDLKGRLFETGFGTIRSRWRASDPHNAARVRVTLTDLGLAGISPYIRDVTGHEVGAGRLDLTLEYEHDEGTLETKGRLTINELRLDQHTGEAWPLELAVALLEDRNEYIDITLPVYSTIPQAESTVVAQLIGRLHDFVLAVIANPFGEMAVIAGLPDEPLDRVPFEPGSAETAPPALTRIAGLSAALAARPRLGLTIYPAFGPVVDRLALATQQVRLHVALATSEGPPGQVVGKPIDFNNSKVRGILDEFAAARLSPSVRATISRDHSEQDDLFYRAVFDALVENEKVPTTALERLAGYRAQSLINELKTNGIEAARLMRSDVVELTVANHGAINLRLEATTMRNIRTESETTNPPP